MFVIAVLIQTVWLAVAAADVNVMVALSFTVIVPLKEGLTHGPVVVTV